MLFRDIQTQEARAQRDPLIDGETDAKLIQKLLAGIDFDAVEVSIKTVAVAGSIEEDQRVVGANTEDVGRQRPIPLAQPRIGRQTTQRETSYVETSYHCHMPVVLRRVVE